MLKNSYKRWREVHQKRLFCFFFCLYNLYFDKDGRTEVFIYGAVCCGFSHNYRVAVDWEACWRGWEGLGGRDTTQGTSLHPHTLNLTYTHRSITGSWSRSSRSSREAASQHQTRIGGPGRKFAQSSEMQLCPASLLLTPQFRAKPLLPQTFTSQ